VNRSVLCLLVIFLAITADHTSASAASQITASINPPFVQADMGDKITYVGTIKNNSDRAVHDIIAYISLANVTKGKESPMDLEDWSADKAVKVDTIQPHGTYEGRWPMRLIDSGSYVAYITVVDKNDHIPISSTMSRLEIRRILRLNPHQVLPIAIGEPVVLGLGFMFVALRRRKAGR
jgi:hypothetical protein